ncbi:MAG: M23 family metallopeptidase, partial [Phycisphaerae bacterium]|nr:M23 family metallopeptidase [Saprospiraceae bacterium]
FDKPQRAAAALTMVEKEIHPTDYFAQPVTGAIHLTGTCGELRPNHFHAGLDIDGITGNPVFAAADGYIETIKVQASGYGNALYIRHPNGYITLYAHLDHFTADLQQFVKNSQYEQERFEVELKPPDGLFKVHKGQQIAYLGNTGSSQGPHLHFEVRSPSGKAVNPLLCGIKVVDKVAPEFRDMKVYFLNDHREVLGSKPFSLQKDKKGNIGLEGDTVRIGGAFVGFGVKTYDHTTGFRNDNGVYSVALFANDQLAFQWTADEFDFDDSRYINAHIDYSVRQRYGAWFHRCFTLPGDFLSNYTRTSTMGAISLDKDKPTKITLNISDASGNSRQLNFWALRNESAMETFLSAPYQFLLPFDAESHIDLEGISIALPKGALYETVPLQYMSSQDSSNDIFSHMHNLHDEQTPIHKSFTLKIMPTRLPPALRSKAVIANCNEGKPDNCGGTWQGEWLSTQIRTFGDFCIMADTIPPRITPVVFAADMRRKNTMAFRILDNFAITGTAENFTYRGTIDGQWALFEFDKKRNRLTYAFDNRVGKGEHTLRITARDDRANEGVFEGKFLR